MHPTMLALKHYLETIPGLSVAPDTTNVDRFAIRETEGRILTISWETPGYIRVYGEFGMRTEVFRVAENLATLSPLHSPDQKMWVDECGDYTSSLLAKLPLPILAG